MSPPDVRDFYVSGPMTGYPDFNFPAFADAARRLRDAGHSVYSPHECFNGSQTMAYADYIREDVRLVCLSRAVVVLPGWEHSKGANLEVHLAHTLGIPVLDVATALAHRGESR